MICFIALFRPMNSLACQFCRYAHVYVASWRCSNHFYIDFTKTTAVNYVYYILLKGLSVLLRFSIGHPNLPSRHSRIERKSVDGKGDFVEQDSRRKRISWHDFLTRYNTFLAVFVRCQNLIYEIKFTFIWTRQYNTISEKTYLLCNHKFSLQNTLLSDDCREITLNASTSINLWNTGNGCWLYCCHEKVIFFRAK